MTKQLKALDQISDMILDLKLTALQKASQNAEAIEAKIAELEAARQGRAVALSQKASLDMAQLSGRDEAWNSWMQNARRTHNLELAKLYAEREERMAEARHAMGRADVIKSIIKKQAAKRVG
jgi:Mg2+ and Co2+ transporter CorA